MYEFHGEHHGAIDCYYCDNSFKTKRDMMNHRKTAYIEKVNNCSNFETCWYKHSPTGSYDKTEFKCHIIFCIERSVATRVLQL